MTVDEEAKKKSRTRKDLQTVALQAAGSKHSRNVLNFAAGDDNTGWKESDAQAVLFDATEDMYMQVREQIEKSHPETYKALFNVFIEPDFAKRRAYFESLGVKFPAPKPLEAPASK